MSSTSGSSFRAPRIEGADGLALVALTEADLPLVRRWLHQPHLGHVWNPPDEGIAEIAEHIGRTHVAPYLIVETGRPVGYLQTYHANPDEFWAAHDLPRETYGLDLFIGPPELIGKGLGTQAVRLAVRHLAALPDTARLHIDPEPGNAAAIRTYEKAGFRKAGEIETPDGRCLYMILEPGHASLDAQTGERP